MDPAHEKPSRKRVIRIEASYDASPYNEHLWRTALQTLAILDRRREQRADDETLNERAKV